MNKKALSEAAKIIARRGGRATLKKYGRKHFTKMAKKRWAEEKGYKEYLKTKKIKNKK